MKLPKTVQKNLLVLLVRDSQEARLHAAFSIDV